MISSVAELIEYFEGLGFRPCVMPLHMVFDQLWIPSAQWYEVADRLDARKLTRGEGVANLDGVDLLPHPDVKLVAPNTRIRILRSLACRLVTPPGGVVLDPFAGSGSCGVAAALEGFGYLGIELDEWGDNGPRAKGAAPYVDIARARIRHAQEYPGAWEDTAPGYDGSSSDYDRDELERNGQQGLFGGEE